MIQVTAIRELLLPGLIGITGSYRRITIDDLWYVEAFEPAVSAPHIWIPKLTVPQAIAVGAAAAVIKNPAITRRFWAGWFSPNSGGAKSGD